MKNKSALDKILRTINGETNGYYLRYKIRDILKENRLDEKFVLENFDYLIMNVNSNNFARFLNYISTEATLSDNVLNKFSIFIRRFKTGDILDKEQEAFLTMMTFLPGYKKIFYKNMRNIIESISPGVLFEKASLLKEISPRYSKKINDIINSNQDRICRHILFSCLSKNNNEFSMKDLNDYSLTLQILLRKVLKSERKKLSDVEKVGEGAYSKNYKIGDKVLKIGAPRETYFIPNHRRILQPLARINLTDSNHKSIGTIELTSEENASKEAIDKITKEDLYRIYKELRDDGIVWGDPKIDNLAILKRKNIPMLNGKLFYVNPSSVGFNNDLNGVKPLDKGDIVIIDTDYLYRQEEKNKKGNINSYVLDFERRYQNEKKRNNKALQNNYQSNKLHGKEKENDDELDY